MTRDELDLLHTYLDGTLPEADWPRFQHLLRESADARCTLRSLSTVEVKLQELAAADPTALRLLAPPPLPAFSAREKPSGWLGRMRPFTAAAAGLVIGLFSASIVFAYTSPKLAGARATVQRLWDESFETGAPPAAVGLPREIGIWSGDEARVVTRVEGAIPASGEKMLRFIRATFAGEDAPRSAWGDLFRLVDLRGQVGPGRSALRLTASFQAAHFPAGEEYWSSVELCALEGDLAAAPQPLTLPWVRENSAAAAFHKEPLATPGRWQKATIEIPVTPQTRYVLLHLAMLRRKPFPPTTPVEFEAHFLDDVRLELVTLPAAP